MAEKDDERVDWVRPVATDVPVSKLDAHKLARAAAEHGVKVDINEGSKTATIVQEVVTGMPAASKEKPQEKK